MPSPAQHTHFSISKQHPVAYFCAEFGFDTNLPLYAGGLGILAGDTIKSAADQAFPLVGIGLLYHGAGMVQEITGVGYQIDKNFEFDPLSSGLEHVYAANDTPLFVKVHLTEVDIWLRCWKKTFDNDTVLYLLDTDTDQNLPSERQINQMLYSGTDESQLKQQFLLGIGGVKLLKALHIEPSLYHINEGRPAFLHWQLIRQLMDTHAIDYHSAHILAKSKTVYTNHTLVGAGNQSYPSELIQRYAKYYSEKMRVNLDELMAPGIEDSPDSFNITRFALNASSVANGVSELHTKLSQAQWPEYSWINVTNGVHMPTWQDPTVAACTNPQELWQVHQQKKQELSQYVQRKTGYGYDPNQLVITWARRVAGYKQLSVLFDDIARLKSILTKKNHTVQLLVAGKAHQGDTVAKQMLQKVIGYFQNQLSGQALFIPNYSIEVAQMLVKGSDVWLNTPMIGKEACGTSGMKAISNGVLHCSVNDGWVAETDWTDTGWVLDSNLLSATLYSLLENTIVPLYYDASYPGFPRQWVKRMQNSIKLSERFSSHRMLNEYQQKLYLAQD